MIFWSGIFCPVLIFLILINLHLDLLLLLCILKIFVFFFFFFFFFLAFLLRSAVLSFCLWGPKRLRLPPKERLLLLLVLLWFFVLHLFLLPLLPLVLLPPWLFSCPRSLRMPYQMPDFRPSDFDHNYHIITLRHPVSSSESVWRVARRSKKTSVYCLRNRRPRADTPQSNTEVSTRLPLHLPKHTIRGISSVPWPLITSVSILVADGQGRP